MKIMNDSETGCLGCFDKNDEIQQLRACLQRVVGAYKVGWSMQDALEKADELLKKGQDDG